MEQRERRRVGVSMMLSLDVLSEWTDDELRAYLGNKMIEAFGERLSKVEYLPGGNPYITFTHADGTFSG